MRPKKLPARAWKLLALRAGFEDSWENASERVGNCESGCSRRIPDFQNVTHNQEALLGRNPDLGPAALNENAMLPHDGLGLFQEVVGTA